MSEASEDRKALDRAASITSNRENAQLAGRMADQDGALAIARRQHPGHTLALVMATNGARYNFRCLDCDARLVVGALAASAEPR